MANFNPKKLAERQRDAAALRNICILAHVDHGKTTLADNLLASNGIISSRMAGKLRFLDSRKDEQERGITMKSSAVTLIHRCAMTFADDKPYIINVIDSPGHVDFSSEVSTAVRLSDGALVLVDVVEGVSAQTHAVLRQAWVEKLRPCLFLNKIDRLIHELQMTPEEAYQHLQRILEQVNAITAALYTSSVMSQRDVIEDSSGQHEEESDDFLYFEPERGNVAFGSALEGWAFTVNDFAAIMAKKFECKEAPLRKSLWGDYFITTVDGKMSIKKGAMQKAKSNNFVKFVLKPLWDVNHTLLQRGDKERINKMVAALGVSVSARDAQGEPRAHLRAVLQGWLPLATSVLNMVCRSLPAPNDVDQERFRLLLGKNRSSQQQLSDDLERMSADMKACRVDDATPVVFVSKMVAVPKSLLPENEKLRASMAELKKRHDALIARRKAAEQQSEQSEQSEQIDEGTPIDLPDQEDSESSRDVVTVPEKGRVPSLDDKPQDDDAVEFIAYARVFSGSLKPGMQVEVLGPKYDPSKPSEHRTTATIDKLYLFMGRSLFPLAEAVAGTVVGIGGMQGHILKTATLSTSMACPSLLGLNQLVQPIVRVAIETERIADMPILKQGLSLLNQADPCVEVYVQNTGEHVLVAAGEVHIERCLTDLREQFAKGVKLIVSPPIIPFRETVIIPPSVDATNEEITELNCGDNRANNFLLDSDLVVDDSLAVTIQTSNKRWALTVRARPLPQAMIAQIEKQQALLARATAGSGQRKGQGSTGEDTEEVSEDQQALSSEERQQLRKSFEDTLSGASTWQDFNDCLWTCGPHGVGPNVLLNRVEALKGIELFSTTSPAPSEIASFANSIKVGFELLSQAGPLCEEPLRGVALELLSVTVDEDAMLPEGGFAGQVMATMKEACRQALLVQPIRLMTAMYACDLFVSSASLGKVYTVISKRAGRVISEDMKEGTDTFSVKAVIPVTNSFGFSDELRKRTSGLAVPQLVFSHWETIEEDPFWVPTTEEEKAHFGDLGDAPNLARKFMDLTRKRKGMAVEEKIVEHAEKQRTISRKK